MNIAPGFNLWAKFVIHAAGPVYQHWNKERIRKIACSSARSASCSRRRLYASMV
ncbi:MAG: macro domain-containing protein [Dethiobacter sp.]|nr:macro domain-containing protein [Dethiobacter sp.]MBS3899356.1 macro domain-containing protein [Dethiobacter sp.]MBS3982276.1 macro domain-containing protein [Dethiobacter sp.]